MTNPTIPRFLKDSFDLYGARIALIDGDRSITYQQLAKAGNGTSRPGGRLEHDSDEPRNQSGRTSCA
jgi:hypothetical protein